MGAISTSGGYLPFFFAFVLPIMVPLITLWAISFGGSGQTQLDLAIALATVLFLAVLVSVAADTYKQFRSSYESRRKLSDAIEPILITFIGGLVLILALGVFLPIWDLNTAANG